MLFLGITLGIVDGLNPCIIAVFLFLTAYLLSLGDKKMVLNIGSAYIGTVFFLYLFFMLGLFTIFDALFLREEFYPFISIKNIVSAIIIFVGVSMIKDFFWAGGFSLKIPDSAKPTISRLTKRASLPSAVALASFSTLAGIPCTSGLPLSYITIMAEIGISGYLSFLYIFWYNLFHILPLLILVALFYYGLKAEKAEEWRLRSRKYTKLLSGSIMVLIGIFLIANMI